MSERIALTGAAGRVASLLRPRLARPGRELVLVDVLEPPPMADTGTEVVVNASITDTPAMTQAFEHADAVVHLAAVSVEADFPTVSKLNVKGVASVLEAARQAGMNRVMLASSYHVVGCIPRDAEGVNVLQADVKPRPDTWYGWSKAALEAAGQLYADRYDMIVTCPRIGNWSKAPKRLQALPIWLSPDDGARMVEACISTDKPGCHLLWGISRNTRRWFSLDEGAALGFHPQDDSESYAAQLITEFGEPDIANDPALNRVGGTWCDHPLGKPMTTTSTSKRPKPGG